MFGRRRKPVDVGDKAPDFELKDQNGQSLRLSALLGKTVVLYFYPKDDTYYCVAESIDFRDHYPQFTSGNAEVIGVSSDSSDSHTRFAAKYKLPFRLLSDPGGKLRRLYGVPATLGVIPGRVTYVIDPEGIVRKIVNSQFNPKSHVEEALEALSHAVPSR
jgi:thioredoxin-dependent peroxiredoxin